MKWRQDFDKTPLRKEQWVEVNRKEGVWVEVWVELWDDGKWHVVDYKYPRGKSLATLPTKEAAMLAAVMLLD